MRKVWQVTIQIVTDEVDIITPDDVEDEFLEMLSENVIDCNYVFAELIGEFNEKD